MAVLLKPLIDALAALNRPVGAAGVALAALLLSVMATLVLAQIFSRAAFGQSFSWIEEACRAMLVWSAFLIAPFALRTSANASIDVFRDALPAVFARGLALVIQLLIAWITAVFFRESLAFVARGMELEASTLPIRVGYFYLIAPIGLGLLFLVALELALRSALMLVRPDEDHTVPRAPLVAPE